MVGKWFLLLFTVVTICVHIPESFKLSRELFGKENVVPSGNNNIDNKNKTYITMEKTTIEYQYNAALSVAQTKQDNKNPFTCLL